MGEEQGEGTSGLGVTKAILRRRGQKTPLGLSPAKIVCFGC